MIATRTRRLAAVATLLAVPALSSCGQFDPQTDQVYNPGVGVNERDGMVDVLHALVVTDGSGSGRVIAGLVNNDQSEADELTGVESADGSITVVAARRRTEVPAAGFLQLADAAYVSIEGEGVEAGGFVRLTFTFANAEAATLNVPVMPNTNEFEDVDLSGGSEAEYRRATPPPTPRASERDRRAVHPGPAPPRRERVERPEPLHRLGRRRS